MENLRNIHKDESVFIMGNGPSLNRQDLSPLKNEHLMVSNQFFLNPQITWKPEYYFSVDRKGTAGNLPRIQKNTQGMVRFFEDVWENDIKGERDYFLSIRRKRTDPSFTLDLTQPVRSGYCVLYIQMQVAVWMGFKNIYLIGVDHSKGHFVSEKKYHNNKSHFSLDHLLVERFLNEAERVCKEIGINIINATDGGYLEIFPRHAYEDLVNVS